jgi:beta-glucanase (GH16 family)
VRQTSYGAFFVRSRQTGSGPNEVELLWPQDNSWPPEIDFNETGGQSNLSSGTIHWTVVNHQIQYHVATDLSQWHTWGVIWTPQSVIFTLDGQPWATDEVSASVPHQPMTIDIEQRTVCDPLTQCPSQPTSLLVDWVAAFSPSPSAG